MKIRWISLRWVWISLLVGIASLVLAPSVLAVPYITPSDPSYRGISRGLSQDLVVRDKIVLCARASRGTPFSSGHASEADTYWAYLSTLQWVAETFR